MAKSPSWYIYTAAKGVIDGLIVILIYMYVLPELLANLYASLGYSEVPVQPSETYLAVLVTVLGLSIASRLLESTIFEPILKASANMLGVLFALSYLGSGVITLRNLQAGDFLVDVTFDLGPLMLVFFAFFVVPSVVMPFIDYFTQQKK